MKKVRSKRPETKKISPEKREQPSNSIESGLLAFGWLALLIYLMLGIFLEALHGFKIGWYLDVGNESRRLMFKLGHAHGTLLAVVTIVAGLCERTATTINFPSKAMWTLRLAVCLVPGGFIAGGFGLIGGEPGIGIWLVPLGAIFLLYAIGRIAWSYRKGY